MQIDVQGPITLDEASIVRTAVLECTGVGYTIEQEIPGHYGRTPYPGAGRLDAALCRGFASTILDHAIYRPE